MVRGIHHITALASDPQRNVDFYTGVLGLRLVKQTVNFDAPDVYHLYYGDESGKPGTLLTFFPFPNAARGKRGTGEISAIGFDVPVQSLDFWIARLSRLDIRFDGPLSRFGESTIAFQDPDGMLIELVFNPVLHSVHAWHGSPVPDEYATRKLHGVTFQLAERVPTGTLLENILGFQYEGQDGNRHRYSIGNDLDGAILDIIVRPDMPRARQSAGSIHHIAWRVPDASSQAEYRTRIIAAGLHATDALDRRYFQSVYFREPGGVLFELATDGPGFTVDEPLEELGSRLKLPPWLEPERQRIERILPPLEPPVHSGRRSLADGTTMVDEGNAPADKPGRHEKHRPEVGTNYGGNSVT